MPAPEPREPGKPIRVAVVDDHELVRSGICNALAMSEDIVVVGEAGDGLAALELLQREPVDVLLLDLHMPRMDGFACLDAVTVKWPELPVIVLTVDEDPEVATDVMRRGAAAYVPKFVRPGDLASLVRQVVGGVVLIGGGKLAGALAGQEPTGRARQVCLWIDRQRDGRSWPGRAGQEQRRHSPRALRDHQDGQVPPYRHLLEAWGAQSD